MPRGTPERRAEAGPDADSGPPRSRLKRLGWFVALWAAGVAVVGAVAYLIRLAIVPA